MKKTMMIAAALSLLATLTACSGNSQQSSNTDNGLPTYKVGIVKFMDHISLDEIQQSIIDTLESEGERLQVNFSYEDYLYNGQGDATTLNQIAAQLKSDEVDVIIPIATPAAQVMQAAVEDIPIVFSAVSDPLTDGLVADLETPGSNITGISDALNTQMIMDLMLLTKPDMDTVGLLYSNSETSSTKPIAEATAFFESQGIQVVAKTGTNTDEIITAADALVASGVDAIFTPTDNTVMGAELAIYETLMEAGIPHFGGADSFAIDGAFCGYGVNYTTVGSDTAKMAADLLVNGGDTATTPVQIATGETATINTDVAEALGLSMETLQESYATLGITINETSFS